MTIRQHFERIKRRVMLVAFAGFAVAVLGTLWVRYHPPWSPAPSLTGGITLALGLLYGWLALRCPVCRGSWYSLALRPGQSLFGIDRRLRYCPYCGTGIDTR
jgi:hypothetical protein